MNARTISALSGLVLAWLAVFAAGLLSAHLDLLPYRKLIRVDQLVRSFRRVGRDMAEASYVVRPSYAPDRRYVVYDADAMAPGTVAVTRLDAETRGYVVDLLGMDGSVLHRWTIDHAAIVRGDDAWESPPVTKVLPDGSILVGFDSQAGLARLDGCSTPIWVLQEGVHHHAMHQDGDRGGYWVWRSTTWAGSQDQVLLRFDAESGAELEAIDLLDEVVLRDRETALTFGIPTGFEVMRGAGPREAVNLFHAADIEPLPAAVANAFPQFHAGDLLVSLRNLNMVAVLDRESHAVHWAVQGPWRMPHDADWQPNGTITVFNNNVRRQWSYITVVDPSTNDVRNLFGTAGPRYYTETRGNHQRLPNGNWLIVSANEGRVLEVTAAGRPVREYNNVINDRYNAVLTYAEHVPPDFFERMPACAAG